jgi:hypothetical protein
MEERMRIKYDGLIDKGYSHTEACELMSEDFNSLARAEYFRRLHYENLFANMTEEEFEQWEAENTTPVQKWLDTR